MSISPQQFDYFLVLDFEATCERGIKLKPQEIIEFPCLKVKVILRGERERNVFGSLCTTFAQLILFLILL